MGRDRTWEVRPLPGGGTLTFSRLSAVDAGVTARLDVVDESALPAILLYRNGKLFNARMQVVLPSLQERLADSVNGSESNKVVDKVTEADDLDLLADEVEDLLDDLGLYE